MMMMITIIIIIIIYNRGNLPGNEDILSLRFYNIIVILILKTCTCVYYIFGLAALLLYSDYNVISVVHQSNKTSLSG